MNGISKKKTKKKKKQKKKKKKKKKKKRASELRNDLILPRKVRRQLGIYIKFSHNNKKNIYVPFMHDDYFLQKKIVIIINGIINLITLN